MALAGKSPRQIEKASGRKNPAVSKWMHGHTVPDLATIEKLAKELQVTVRELTGPYPDESRKLASSPADILRGHIPHPQELPSVFETTPENQVKLRNGVWYCPGCCVPLPPEFNFCPYDGTPKPAVINRPEPHPVDVQSKDQPSERNGKTEDE